MPKICTIENQKEFPGFVKVIFLHYNGNTCLFLEITN